MRAKPLYRNDCRKFTGYRPCNTARKDCRDCADYVSRGIRIMLINLDSMGDVLRSTAVLPALKRKYPHSHLTWITMPRAAPLLENNQHIDRILALGPATPFILDSLKFEVAFNVDKGLPSGSMMNRINAGEKLGFGVDEDGSLYPLNPEAGELFQLGLDDDLKFHVNQKTENQLLAEAFQLDYHRDEYVFNFSDEESKHLGETRKRLGLVNNGVVVGFNTGCSNLYPHKKLPVAHQKKIIARLKKLRPDVQIILLGGLEDLERNNAIEQDLPGQVINTPCNEGLRRGMLYTALADVVFTGDSLGMHMAIALQKRIVVWFGLTCHQEIELYGRGEKLLARVNCRPCWQKLCEETVKCYDSVDLNEAVDAIIRQVEEV